MSDGGLDTRPSGHAEYTPITVQAKTVDTRVRWQGHVAAAVIDLRNSDRSPFEQIVYDCLRSILDQATPQR